METNNKPKAYYEESYPPVPTKSVKFWRSCMLWQFYRFIILNYKVMKIVAFGHN
jgi:hypothetical protein